MSNENTEQISAITAGAVAGFVAEVPDRVDLSRNRGKRRAVIVFDAEFERLITPFTY